MTKSAYLPRMLKLPPHQSTLLHLLQQHRKEIQQRKNVGNIYSKHIDFSHEKIKKENERFKSERAKDMQIKSVPVKEIKT